MARAAQCAHGLVRILFLDFETERRARNDTHDLRRVEQRQQVDVAVG